MSAPRYQDRKTVFCNDFHALFVISTGIRFSCKPLLQALRCSPTFLASLAPSAMFVRAWPSAPPCHLSTVNPSLAPPSRFTSMQSLFLCAFICFAGTIFDVVSTHNPINIAYSNMALDLHQDLPYYESPPGVQLLHCLKFSPSVTGEVPITEHVYVHIQTLQHIQRFFYRVAHSVAA